jgi:hypothetical protein
MTKNIDLRKEKGNLLYRDFMCVWEVDKSNLIESSSILWWICLMQDSDTIFSFWNAIFERIISFRLEISDRKLNESEFSNHFWTYFRFLMSIENISKQDSFRKNLY